jgi:hypothetical protein
MSKKNTQEINLDSNRDLKDESTPHDKSLATIRCICGAEILVVPDLKAMELAIENHVDEHIKASNDSERILPPDSLKQFLTEQVLIVASKINQPNVNY